MSMVEATSECYICSVQCEGPASQPPRELTIQSLGREHRPRDHTPGLVSWAVSEKAAPQNQRGSSSEASKGTTGATRTAGLKDLHGCTVHGRRCVLAWFRDLL